MEGRSCQFLSLNKRIKNRFRFKTNRYLVPESIDDHLAASGDPQVQEGQSIFTDILENMGHGRACVNDEEWQERMDIARMEHGNKLS